VKRALHITTHLGWNLRIHLSLECLFMFIVSAIDAAERFHHLKYSYKKELYTAGGYAENKPRGKRCLGKLNKYKKSTDRAQSSGQKTFNYRHEIQIKARDDKKRPISHLATTSAVVGQLKIRISLTYNSSSTSSHPSQKLN
jgi:hypothetical protein